MDGNSAIKDFLHIYTWKELWICVTVAVCIVGTWVYITVACMVPYPFGAVMFWGMFLTLTTGSAGVEFAKKRAYDRT